MLGGSPVPIPQSEHRRPPMLHDVSMQSSVQVQVGALAAGGEAAQAAATKLYRHSLVAAMNSLGAAQHAQAVASSKRAASGYGGAADGGEGADAGDAATAAAAAAAAAPVRGHKVPPPPPAHLLPPVIAQPPRSAVPFDPRSWSAARRILLASCVVRARGLWCIDSAAVAAAVDRWLLPTPAQRTLYQQVGRGKRGWPPRLAVLAAPHR